MTRTLAVRANQYMFGINRRIVVCFRPSVTGVFLVAPCTTPAIKTKQINQRMRCLRYWLATAQPKFKLPASHLLSQNAKLKPKTELPEPR